MTRKPLNIPQELLNHLNFADSAKQIESLKESLFSPLESNQAKVDFLKEEIAANRYYIDNKNIADRILEYSNKKIEAL